MIKLALTFFILLGLTGMVKAQEQPKILSMPIMSVCIDSKRLDASLLDQYGETLAVIGPALVMHDQLKEYVEGVMKIYINTKTLSFTVVFENPKDNLSCVIGTGDDLKPAHRGTQL